MYKVTYKNQCRLLTDDYLVPTETIVGELVHNLLLSHDCEEGIEITVKPTSTKYVDEI
jgi:hypothetical protein